MNAWIIYRKNRAEISPEFYEIDKFVKEGEKVGIKVEIFAPEDFDLVVTREDRKSIRVKGEVRNLPDFIMPRMGAGTTYFALAVIRHMERLGVPCFNSSTSIDTVKDKMFTLQILSEKNLPVPKTMLAKLPVDIELVEKQIGFPVIIKTISGSQGKGVFLSRNKKNFSDLLQLIEAANPDMSIIFQEFVEDSFGRDLRVFVVGGRPIACMKRTAPEDDFKANFSAGGTVESYPMTPEIEWLSMECVKILDLEIAGVDLLFDNGHFKVCEVNSSPGFKGLESCCENNIASEIYDFLSLKLGKR